MFNNYKIDLHIHTCLSPCADLTMLPGAIIDEAVKNNLDCIGICDHNSSENVDAIRNTGNKKGVFVIGGMEITTSEEVHLLALFEKDTELQAMQDIVYNNLAGENDVIFFGEQLVVDEDDRLIGSNPRLLLGATSLSLEKTVNYIHSFNGIVIASHIDRDLFSIIGQLGFIPENLALHALELSPKYKFNKNINIQSLGYTLVTFSDAHHFTDIGRASTTFYMKELSFSELKMALNGDQGRKTGID